MLHRVLKYNQACSNDYLGLTLTFLTTMQLWENANSKESMESFEDFGLKSVYTVDLLNKYMKFHELLYCCFTSTVNI